MLSKAKGVEYDRKNTWYRCTQNCVHVYGCYDSCSGIRGGAASKSNFAGYAAITFMNILVAPAVNIFAIISGYVGFSEAENTTKRYARFLEIWCQVVFYCIVIQFAAILLKIDTFSITKIIKCFLPITFNAYWYVRAYFATVLIAPLINAAVASIGKQKLLSISFVLFLCFVFMENALAV